MFMMNKIYINHTLFWSENRFSAMIQNPILVFVKGTRVTVTSWLAYKNT